MFEKLSDDSIFIKGFVKLVAKVLDKE